jgi:hypothetical protein
MTRVTSEQMRRAALRGDVATFERMARRMRHDVLTELAGKFASRVVAPLVIGIGQAIAGTWDALTSRPGDLRVDRMNARQLADIGMIGKVRPMDPANDLDRSLDRVA